MSDTTILERARAGQEPPDSGGDHGGSVGGPGRTDPPEPSGGGGGLVRVTVNLTPAAAQAMERLCDETGYSKTDVINRALQVYEVWQEIAQRNGGTVAIKHQDGETERIRLL
jgi:hypothetical protein